MTTLPERILSGEVEAPDLFCGGTPCQAFSVAGLRNSLDDARGNLSLTFVGIANAIDHVRSVRGEPASIVFWENVPGVLSTKDNAFGCFLAGLAGEDNPLEPAGGKWTNAGYVLGPKRAVAWRLLDAQYFGVAQRRKRVFVVASARADFDPAAVLFEFDGVRRDTAPSREKGQEAAGTIAARFGVSRNNHEECVSTYSTPAIGNIVTDDISSCIARNTGSGGETQNPAFVVQPVTACRKVALGEYANDDVASTMKARDYKEATDLVAQPIAFTTEQTPKFNNDQALTLTKSEYKHNQCVAHSMPAIAHSLTASRSSTQCPNEDTTLVPIALQDITPREKAQNGRGWNDDGTAYTVDTHATQGVAQPIAFAQNQRDEVRIMQIAGALAAEPGMKQQTYLAQAIPIDTMNMTPGHSSGGLGFGQPGDPSFTLTKGHSHAVAQPITFSSVQSNQGINADLNVSQTLEAKNPMAVAQPIIGGVDYENNAHGPDDVTGPLLKGSPTGGGRPLPAIAYEVAMAFRENTRSEVQFYGQAGEITGALTSGGGKPGQGYPAALVNMAVRRLTPVECERLQGFPDNYTNIPWRKKDESPDGPRYKALGNSWAVPNVRWIGKRIQEALDALP
jgi:DNA (cytosine-5)-methyltransferase 1